MARRRCGSSERCVGSMRGKLEMVVRVCPAGKVIAWALTKRSEVSLLYGTGCYNSFVLFVRYWAGCPKAACFVTSSLV
jgi:hypothetical protein